MNSKRQFYCNPFTFGKSKAAQTLAKILNNESPKVCEQVSNIFHTASAIFKDLDSLSRKELMMTLYWAHVLVTIDAHNNWSTEVKMFTKNCIKTQMKRYLKKEK